MFILIFLVINVCANDNYQRLSFMHKQLSLVKPFQEAGSLLPFWDFHGSTIVTSQNIRLTPDIQSKKGALWSKVPVNTPHWELELQFHVHGKGTSLYGDGFALWYTKERMQSGDVFGNKNGFSGLAIFFDTYSNYNGEHTHAHPFISAMVSNGSLLYDHDSDGTHTQLSGCHMPFRNKEKSTVLVRYAEDVLSVSMDPKGIGSWEECFISEGVVLPTKYYLGLTSATGELSDNHDVLALRFYELESMTEESPAKDYSLRADRVPSAAHYEVPREHVPESPPTRMRTILIYIVVLIGVGIIIFIGYLYIKDREQKRNKRFY